MLAYNWPAQPFMTSVKSTALPTLLIMWPVAFLPPTLWGRPWFQSHPADNFLLNTRVGQGLFGPNRLRSWSTQPTPSPEICLALETTKDKATKRKNTKGDAKLHTLSDTAFPIMYE
ncbi:uncharacterized protein YALI1_C17519g [Yarrowia lipolytica]|uniref:Uncharacterized protein n=1 Tax=Yarrowia lipolytica TaxID=4952 RepID=A0A1D8NAT7_YARLL|nr:hypothetical protein YALI1_C17519g [Yarrowia lipolytica]